MRKSPNIVRSNISRGQFGNVHGAAIRLLGLATVALFIQSAAANASEVTAAARADGGVVHSVIYDLTRIIHIRGQRGWTIDHYELRALLPDALMTVCRVDPADIDATLGALQRRITELGGPLRAAWKRSGRDLSDHGELLTIHRAHELLTLARAERSKCPFYVTTVRKFRGRHRDTGFVTINVEGGGLASARRRAGSWRFGGGGAGRLTMGFGLSPRWSLRVGPEVGAAALVGTDVSADSVEADYLAALPVTMRRLTPTWHYDFEVAPISLGLPWRERMQYGYRVGWLIGLTSLRVRSVLPWAGYAFSFEQVFGRDGRPGHWAVRTGLRVGFKLRALRF